MLLELFGINFRNIHGLKKVNVFLAKGPDVTFDEASTQSPGLDESAVRCMDD